MTADRAPTTDVVELVLEWANARKALIETDWSTGYKETKGGRKEWAGPPIDVQRLANAEEALMKWTRAHERR